MPKVDFDKVDDVEDYTPVPAGKYLCTLTDVQDTDRDGRPLTTRESGDEMWRLRFRVAEGDYKGRSVFDNMVFSAAALKRVKLICSRLGLDVSKPVDLTPEMIKGKSCLLSVEIEEYIDNEQKPKKRNVVPFAGYERAGAQPAGAGVSPEEDAGEGNLRF